MCNVFTKNAVRYSEPPLSMDAQSLESRRAAAMEVGGSNEH